jgi:hypothetical protein
MKNELPASHSGVTAKVTRSAQQTKQRWAIQRSPGFQSVEQSMAEVAISCRINCRGNVIKAVRMLYDPGHSLRLDNPGLSWDSFSHPRLLYSTRASC